MSIWKTKPTLEQLQAGHQNTAIAHMGIEYTGMGDDWLAAKMPVDTRTVQPMGLLHGGASVLLAESVGSCAASLSIDMNTHFCVGLDINANHIRGVRSGWVFAVAKPIHLGQTTQVWEIRISDEADKLVCMSRLTMAVVPRK